MFTAQGRSGYRGRVGLGSGFIGICDWGLDLGDRVERDFGFGLSDDG